MRKIIWGAIFFVLGGVAGISSCTSPSQARPAVLTEGVAVRVTPVLDVESPGQPASRTVVLESPPILLLRHHDSRLMPNGWCGVWGRGPAQKLVLWVPEGFTLSAYPGYLKGTAWTPLVNAAHEASAAAYKASNPNASVTFGRDEFVAEGADGSLASVSGPIEHLLQHSKLAECQTPADYVAGARGFRLRVRVTVTGGVPSELPLPTVGYLYRVPEIR